MELGRRVRERRRAVGLTQSELATPLSRGFISAVENGQALPSLGALWLFAARLGIGVGDLVDGVDGAGGLSGVKGLATMEYTAPHEHIAFDTRLGSRHRTTAKPHRR
jgi:transcriptional regulator with XRE-family HTH domain